MTTYMNPITPHTSKAFAGILCPQRLGGVEAERGNRVALVGRCVR
jgi:hypothetical protein